MNIKSILFLFAAACFLIAAVLQYSSGNPQAAIANFAAALLCAVAAKVNKKKNT